MDVLPQLDLPDEQGRLFLRWQHLEPLHIGECCEEVVQANPGSIPGHRSYVKRV